MVVGELGMDIEHGTTISQRGQEKQRKKEIKRTDSTTIVGVL